MNKTNFFIIFDISFKVQVQTKQIKMTLLIEK